MCCAFACVTEVLYNKEKNPRHGRFISAACSAFELASTLCSAQVQLPTAPPRGDSDRQEGGAGGKKAPEETLACSIGSIVTALARCFQGQKCAAWVDAAARVSQHVRSNPLLAPQHASALAAAARVLKLAPSCGVGLNFLGHAQSRPASVCTSGFGVSQTRKGGGRSGQ